MGEILRMEKQIKYMIGRGDEESVLDLLGYREYLNEEQKFIPFKLEMKATLFKTKEEANQFIIDKLPDLRIRNLVNKTKKYYEAFEVTCVKDIYYFDKRRPYKPRELHMIYEYNDKILTEISSKVYTFEKVTSFQKKQPEGYLGKYYVL